MTLLADMACSSASPSVPTLHIQPICEPHTATAEHSPIHTPKQLSCPHTPAQNHRDPAHIWTYDTAALSLWITHTPTHTHTHTHTHAHTHFIAAVSISTLANQQRGFITHQISFRFAMKDQFIKNALNMSGFSWRYMEEGGSGVVEINLDCLSSLSPLLYSLPPFSSFFCLFGACSVASRMAVISSFVSESVSRATMLVQGYPFSPSIHWRCLFGPSCWSDGFGCKPVLH